MKKHVPQPVQTSIPSVVWEQNDRFLSPSERKDIKQKVVKGYPHRKIFVADADNTDFKTNFESTVISVEEQLSVFNHFDLPFGCQQPTAAHAQILASLIKGAFLPEIPLETVVSFLRHMYHQYSANGQPQLFRLVDAQNLPFYEQWEKRYTWLEEFDRESWWDVSKRLSQLGHHEDALLAHYQAMPTSTEFQKILKDLGNFESTTDGRWLSNSTANAAKKVDRPGLGVYGAQINLKTTKHNETGDLWLQLNNRNSVVSKTKSVERFLCTLLMVYRCTSSHDIVKHLQTLPQNLYLGNSDFDLVDPVRNQEVLEYHQKCLQNDTTVVWEQMDVPLASANIQELWVTLSMATISDKSAVVFGDGIAAGSIQWYDDVSGTERATSSNHWLCFSSSANVNFAPPISVGKESVSSTEEWQKLLNPTTAAIT